MTPFFDRRKREFGLFCNQYSGPDKKHAHLRKLGKPNAQEKV